MPVVDRGALVVGEWDGGEHSLQVVLGFQQLCLGGALGGVKIAAGAGHPVLALLEEAVAAPAVPEVVVLPGLAVAGRGGGDGVAVDEDLDGSGSRVTDCQGSGASTQVDTEGFPLQDPFGHHADRTARNR